MGAPAWSTDVARPRDQAARDETFLTHKSETSIGAATESTVAAFTNSSGEPLSIDQVSVVVADGTNIATDDVYCQFIVEDDSQTAQVNFPIPIGEVVNIPGGEPLPDGWQAGILLENHTAGSILFSGALRYR